MNQQVIKGKLLLHWETGMEEGCMCIQDMDYIVYIPANYHEPLVFHKNNQFSPGVIHRQVACVEHGWLEFPGLFNGPFILPANTKFRASVKWADGVIEHSIPGEELVVEKYLYEGLIPLKATDLLKVEDPISKRVICEGVIGQIPLTIYSEHESGHFDQIAQNATSSCNWEKYFKENCYAEVHRTK
jgi:hypothetical protein